MLINDEIEWWTKHAFLSNTDAAFIAFGVATGLKIARADYGAKDNGNPSIDLRIPRADRFSDG